MRGRRVVLTLALPADAEAGDTPVAGGEEVTLFVGGSGTIRDLAGNAYYGTGGGVVENRTVTIASEPVAITGIEMVGGTLTVTFDTDILGSSNPSKHHFTVKLRKVAGDGRVYFNEGPPGSVAVSDTPWC